ncbi:glycan-binding surface protein [Draconibacterium sediminis]|uniref:glycan-binding surface protein n=1 Tax=Draconibacterium sediminis TaxID=1544798 RepID=UPI0026F105C2|nr:glycan-binding surface protein [Draconibacterium sediminis]
MKIEMKSKHYILTLIIVFSTLSSSMLFTACEKDDEMLDTDQLGSKEVTLKSFGPSPAMRGGELRFIGTNLDQVTSIDVPGATGLTDITVVTQYEIRVTIPQSAEPGIVKLNFPEGSISSQSVLSYSEPISIDRFEPAQVKAGQKLTISGEYLNNVEEVILADGIHVLKKDFLKQTREAIELTIPEEAQTGKIIVSDGADLLSGGEEIPTWIYSSSDLTVVLPSISTISPNPVKAGSLVAITGSDLDLVKSVVFKGDFKVDSFQTQTATKIEINVPERTEDGSLIIIPASGVEVKSESELIMVVPELNVSPTTIKNGGSIIVKGTDLDLIERVIFEGGIEGTISDQTGTEMTVVVPDEAISGVVRFLTKASKEVNGPELTLIDPGFSSFAPQEAKANNSIIIKGTDLDLVVDVVFSGGLSGTIENQSETQLQVRIPVGASSGIIELVAKNGVRISSPSEITITANLPEITGFAENKGTPGEILTIQGTNLLLIKELIFPGNIKATAYGIKTDETVQVYVPQDATTGYGNITLITYEGEQGLSPEIFIGGTDPITDATIMVMDFEQHGDHNGSWDNSWSGSSEILTENGNTFIRYTSSFDGWALNCNHQSSGAPAPVIQNIENYILKFDIRIEEGVTGAENAQLQFVFADQWSYWYGPNLFPSETGGDWITVSVPVSTWGLTGTFDLSSGTNGLYGGIIPAGISIDNLRFDPI